MRCDSWSNCLVIAFLFLVVATIAATVAGLLTWLAWNGIVVGWFHGPAISYWQAIVIWFVLVFIVGGARGSRSSQ